MVDYNKDSAPGNLPNWSPTPPDSPWSGPIPDEPWYAVQGRFGTVDFWVQRGSDSEGRRIGIYERPYARGANLEDMGAVPRETSVSALLVKSQVKEMQRLRDAGIPKTYRDPTLGSYTAILKDISVSWDAQKLNLYGCELSFIRHGIQSRVSSTPSPQSSYDAAKAQSDAIFAKVTAVGEQPDMDGTVITGATLGDTFSDATADSSADFTTAWTNFDNALSTELENSPDPAIGANALSRSYTTLVETGDVFVGVVEDFAGTYTQLLADTADLMYSFRDDMLTLGGLALDAVNAVADEPESWAKILITDPIDLAVLIQRELGIVSENIVATVMESNQPGFVIDPMMLPAGLEINIPVNLDEFS